MLLALCLNKLLIIRSVVIKMKSNKDSKKKQKHSDFEDASLGSKSPKSAKKDRGSKRRLSIYDEFDDDLELNDFDSDDELYDN